MVHLEPPTVKHLLLPPQLLFFTGDFVVNCLGDSDSGVFIASSDIVD